MFCSATWNHFSNFGRGTLLCKDSEIGPLVKDEMAFEDFLFVTLAAILFSRVEPLRPSWNSDQQNFSLFRSCCYRAVSAQGDQKFGKRC